MKNFPFENKKKKKKKRLVTTKRAKKTRQCKMEKIYIYTRIIIYNEKSINIIVVVKINSEVQRHVT